MPLRLKSLGRLLPPVIQFALAGVLVLYLDELGVFPSPEACLVSLFTPTSACPDDQKIAYFGLRFALSIFWLGFVFTCIYWALGWLITKVGGMLGLH